MVKRHSLLKAGNVIAALATIVVNTLAGIGWINNTPTNAISDKYPTLFTPAGLTFMIWGLIYALMVVFIIIQLKGIRKGDPPAFIGTISGYFILSCLANIAWIFIWQYGYITWSLIPMVLLLLCLIEIYTRLGIGKTQVSRRERYGVHLLFSVYLGWITVATVANVAAYLVAIGWNRFGITDVTWFGVIISIATIIAILVIWTRKDFAYTLVFIWAYAGIIIKHLMEKEVHPILAAYTAVMIVILIFAYIIRLVANRTGLKEPTPETPPSPPPAEAPPAPQPTPEPPQTPIPPQEPPTPPAP